MNLQVGTGDIAPPIANATQAAAILTSSRQTRSTSVPDQASGHVKQQPGRPPIPPRRRSFGRQIGGPPSSHKAGKIKEPAIGTKALGYGRPSCLSQGQERDIPGRSNSPINIPSTEQDCRAQATRRRSLVARLSLRKSSKEQLGTSREPVPVL